MKQSLNASFWNVVTSVKTYFYQNCWLVGIIENSTVLRVYIFTCIYLLAHKWICIFIMLIEHIFALFYSVGFIICVAWYTCSYELHLKNKRKINELGTVIKIKWPYKNRVERNPNRASLESKPTEACSELSNAYMIPSLPLASKFTSSTSA
jgi:hypothetical protein